MERENEKKKIENFIQVWSNNLHRFTDSINQREQKDHPKAKLHREKLSQDAEKLSKFNFPTSNRKKEKKRKIKLN